MIQVHFYNETNENKPFFEKTMESPPRMGEEVMVLIDPTNPRMRANFSVVRVMTTTAIFETGFEIKTIVLKEITVNQGQADINQNQASSQ